jgi:DEAD/DEAH box helicase domain-containing protein
VDVDYYTDASLAVDLEVLESFDKTPAPGCLAEHGEVAVREVATIFKKIKLETNENVGWGRISIPEDSRHTTGYWFSLDEDATEGLARGELQDGLWGMAHLLKNLAPIFLMCDARDLQSVAQIRSPFTERPTLFLYEQQPGGVGMAPRLFAIHGGLMSAALELVERCACPAGCPGCVGPSIGDHGTNKRAAITLLRRLASCVGRPSPAVALETPSDNLARPSAAVARP